MKRSRGSSQILALNEEVLLRGKAYLCFSKDGDRFEGHLETMDQCQYGLIGSRQAGVNVESLSGLLGPQERLSGVYELTVIDHEEGLEYILPRVVHLNGLSNGQNCALESEHVTFKAESSYKGHRADLLIQQFLSPRLLGMDLHVVSGPIDVRYTMQSPGLRFIESKPWLM